MDEKRIALLIDSDNISAKYLDYILDKVNEEGIATYRRIYGDWTRPTAASWKKTLLENSLTPIQQFSNTFGKNSTDSALIIDAMDLMHESNYQCMCIVSSDSDFSKLASRLRESEIYVVGMGETKTPVSFRSSCDKFLYLDVLLNKYQEAEMRLKAEQAATRLQEQSKGEKADEKSGLNKAVIIEAIDTIISDESDEDGWIMLSDLGSKLNSKLPDFDVRNFGFSKLSGLIRSLKRYELRGETTAGGSKTAKVFYVRKKD